MMTEPLPLAADGASALEVAREAARHAGYRMREGFGKAVVARTKAERSVVTLVDEAIELDVTTLIRRAYPDHAILAEEDAPGTRSNGWMWVIDPLDGTKNFSQGIPHFAFSIALCFESEPVLGLISQPLLGEEYLAVRGEGLALNGQPARVRETRSLAESVISIDLGFDNERGAGQLALAASLWPSVQGIRTMSSAALGLAYAATGRWDLYLHASLEPWDLAAGLLLVREGGGVITRHDGQPATIFSADVVAGAPLVHADFMARTAAGEAGGR